MTLGLMATDLPQNPDPDLKSPSTDLADPR